MLLRLRLVLITLTMIGIVVALIAGAAMLVIDGIRRDARRMDRLSQLRVWESTLRAEARDLADHLRDIGADPQLAGAISSRDPILVNTTMRSILSRPEEGKDFERLDVIGSDGQLVFSSAGLSVDRALVDVRRLSPTNRISEGLWLGSATDGEDNVHLIAVLELDGGYLAAIRSPASTLAAVAQIYSADAYLRAPTGKLVSGTENRLWELVRPELDSNNENPTINVDGRIYKTVGVELTDLAGSPAGMLFTLRDETAQRERERLARRAILVASAVLLLVVVGLLYGYLRSSLDPLEELAATVKGGAKGNILPVPDLPNRGDEIGSIAEAVRTFQGTAVDLERIRFRRSRERRRSELMIRDRMLELASTLDESTQQLVYRDLEMIEALNVSAASETSSPLAIAFDRMAARVVEQYHELSRLLAERTRDLEIVREALYEREQLTRLRQELEIARELQLSSLPTRFPAFPGRKDFDVFAAMRPAKEVGGDFYDFFLLDENRIAVAIGDASGKGVPAAMFIAMARSLLKAAALRGGDPGECLTFANDVLAADNPQMMFATAILAIMDTRDGRVVLSNAGHNPPYVLRRSGAVETVNGFCGPALGVVDDGIKFDTLTTTLEPGETLFFFTDGVTEATDISLCLFESERLEATLSQLGTVEPREAVENVQRTVDRFTGTAAQADDITMLALTLRGLRKPLAIAA